MFSLRNRLFSPTPAPLALLFLLLAAFPGAAQTPNARPSFAPGGDVTVAEDAGPQHTAWATSLSAGPTGEAAQSLSFSVTHDNPALFAAPPALDRQGNLSFTPAPNAYGTATVTVLLRDNGGGGVEYGPARTFAITVTPVNDAPRFTEGPNVSVAEDGGPQHIAGWATEVAAGPANESAQSLAFLVTASPTTLFKALPTLDRQGNLTFTPAPGAYGTATVTVVLRDNGGTENGGAARSLPQTFTLSISPSTTRLFSRRSPLGSWPGTALPSPSR